MERNDSQQYPLEELESPLIAAEVEIETGAEPENGSKTESIDERISVRPEVRHQVAQVFAGHSALEPIVVQVRAIQRELREHAQRFEALRTGIAAALWPTISEGEANVAHNGGAVCFRSISDVRETLASFEQESAHDLLRAADLIGLTSVAVADFARCKTDSAVLNAYFSMWGCGRADSLIEKWRNLRLRMVRAGSPDSIHAASIRYLSAKWRRGEVSKQENREFNVHLQAYLLRRSLFVPDKSASGGPRYTLALHILIHSSEAGSSAGEQLADYLRQTAPLTVQRDKLLEEEAHAVWLRDSIKSVSSKADSWLKSQKLRRGEVVFASQQLPELRGELLTQYQEAPEREIESAWQATWVVELFGELRTRLSAAGLSLSDQEVLFTRLLRAGRRRDALDLATKATAPHDTYTREQLLWLQQLGEPARNEEGLLDEGVLPYLNALTRDSGTLDAPGFIAQLFQGDLQAKQHFRRVLRNELLEELGVSAGSFADAQPAAGKKAKPVLTRSAELVAQGETDDEPSSGEKERVLRNIQGVVYFESMDPLAKEELELAKLTGFLEKSERATLIPFDVHQPISPQDWESAVTPHLEEYLLDPARPRAGNPDRVARQFFRALLGEGRAFGYYAPGANNFHPAGGDRAYYIVFRQLETQEGRFVVWKLSKYEKEVRRTKKRK